MSTNTNPGATQVDVRGPRFTAWVTTAVLVLTLVVWAFSPIGAAVVLGAQAVVFGIGAARGPRQHPYGLVFANVVAPRLGPATEREPAAPLRFAQLVGLVFALAGVLGFAAGVPVLGLVATGLALAAAFLNAAFGICLGCQIYPLVARIRHQLASNRKDLVHGSL
jgi:membrane associated rhomboid family serine protease